MFFSDDNLGLFFYTFRSSEPTKGFLVDPDAQGKPDVLWDGIHLYVMVWKSGSLATLYKYSFEASTETWQTEKCV